MKIAHRQFLPFAGILLIASLVWAWPTFVRYTTTAPLPFIAAMALALVVYLPALFFLWLFIRKGHTPRILFWAVPLSVILLFGPLAAATNAFFRTQHISEYLFAGFSEETWKIMPLTIILIFFPKVVKNVKDGIFIGALGGLGFAIFEMGAYFALVNYPKTGWENFFSESLPRATLIGIDIHMVWSAFLGGAIVYGLRHFHGFWRWMVPLLGYLLTILTHSFQDHYGKEFAVLPVVMLAQFLTETLKIPLESLYPYQILMGMFGATVNLIVVNMVLIALLIWMVKKEKREEIA